MNGKHTGAKKERGEKGLGGALLFFHKLGGSWWEVGYRLILLRYENADVFVRRGCGHENLKSRVILRDGGNGCPNITCYWLVFLFQRYGMRIIV